MKKCLNCGYERQPSDDKYGIIPTTECPRCHIIYEKIAESSSKTQISPKEAMNVVHGYKKEHELSDTSSVFSHVTYLVRKKVFTLFDSAFHIYDPNGILAFYARQKAFKLKEDIRLYSGENMRTELLSIQARNIIDFSASYDVIDPSINMKVGALRRKGMKSLLRDEWIIMDTEDKEIGFIKEDSMTLALIRRFLINLIPQKYSGELKGKQVCVFKQNFNPFVMKITLDFSMDKNGLLDRRLGIAGAVLLCAIEGRQGGGDGD